MDIKSLPSEVRSLLRSGMNINNVSHCVQELVFNSLDAKSTAVAVRINLQNFRIQVVDNGRGISQLDMGFVGVRYMTSKCQALQDLKHRTKYYGFRGESLANIAYVSEKVTITSKMLGSDCTYSKVIEKQQFSDVVEAKERPEHGTTVTVENFLYNVPVRQKCIKSDQGVEAVKGCLELLVVIHPKVSFSLRNDANLKMILKVNKSDSVLTSFLGLNPAIEAKDVAICEVSKGHVSISGLIYTKSHTNKRLQLIYVNKRPVACSKINKQVKMFYKQARSKKAEFLQSTDYPAYVLNISCPYSEVDFTYDSAKMSVQFKNFDLVLKCVEKLFCKEWGIVKEVEAKKADVISNTGGISISNIPNVVKTKPIKRKVVEEKCIEEQQPKVSKDLAVEKKKKRNFFLADDVVEKAASSNMNMRIYSYKNHEEAEDSLERIPSNKSQIGLQDQSQGKDYIMDYFLKSTAAYAASNENRSEKDECSCSLASEENSNRSVQKTTEKPFETHKQDFGTALSTITFNNIAKKKRAERLNNVYYSGSDAKNHKKETKFVSKAVQTDPVIIKEQSSFDEINAFHYYLPEGQGWAENFEPNVSRYFFPHNDKKSTTSCFHRKKNNNNNICLDVTAKDIALSFHHKSRDLDFFSEDYPKPVFPPLDVKKEFNNSLFTLDNITISPQKKKHRTDKIHHNIFKRKTEESVSVPFFETSPDENQQKWKSAETTPVCKQSFKDLFKTKKSEFFTKKPGLLGGKKNFLQTNAEKNTQPLAFSIKSNDKQMLLKTDIDLEENLYRKKSEQTQECSGKNFQAGEAISGAKTCFVETNVFQNDQNNNLFKFKQRLDLLPKGCSPIMSAFAKVDKVLSPRSKEFLEKTILQSFEDELQTMKWKHYLKNNDLNSFLNILYQEKARQFEKAIPKASTPTKTTFSRNIFDEIDLLMQVDKKFLAVVDKKRKLLYFFDQHAVDERIRVEMLFKEYRQDKKYQSAPKYVSSYYKQKISLDLDDFDVEIMNIYKTAFNDVGVDFHVLGNTIQIVKVPQCFINKTERTQNNTKTLECLIKALIFEVIQTLNSTKGCLGSTPRIITDVINSEACRGAIKFGDFLTIEEMKSRLSALSRCSLPFQCAHGRPTLTPVVLLKEQEEKASKPNLKNLFKTR